MLEHAGKRTLPQTDNREQDNLRGCRFSRWRVKRRSGCAGAVWRRSAKHGSGSGRVLNRRIDPAPKRPSRGYMRCSAHRGPGSSGATHRWPRTLDVRFLGAPIPAAERALEFDAARTPRCTGRYVAASVVGSLDGGRIGGLDGHAGLRAAGRQERLADNRSEKDCAESGGAWSDGDCNCEPAMGLSAST